MTSTANIRDSFECDYLRPHLAPLPYVFASEQAELLHVSNQIRALDDHIAHLSELRRALRLRSHRLRNALALINILPSEVLSRIFQQATGSDDDSGTTFEEYRACFRQASVLTSVSVYFRQVAFATPALWRKIPLSLKSHSDIARASSLLQHYTGNRPLALNVNIAVLDKLDAKGACLAIDTLLTPDLMRSVKAFRLSGSTHATRLWIQKLYSSSFPLLDTFGISCNKMNPSLDLRTLSTTTRLEISRPHPDCHVLMPTSVRFLFLHDVPEQVLVPILYQCPNLEECFLSGYPFFGQFTAVSQANAQFNKPLTLTHLKRLTLSYPLTCNPSSVEKFNLPSLEYLHFKMYEDIYNMFCEFFLFCGNVSATLTSLKIDLDTEHRLELDELFGCSFPKLKKLAFAFLTQDGIQRFIHALAERAEECGNTKPHYLSTLTTLRLRCYQEGVEPRWILALLEKWRVGETSCFYLKVKGNELGPQDWPQELREELVSIVGTRQIEITWGSSRLLQFSGGRDDLLQKAVGT